LTSSLGTSSPKQSSKVILAAVIAAVLMTIADGVGSRA
jgi:hypothetical protein